MPVQIVTTREEPAAVATDVLVLGCFNSPEPLSPGAQKIDAALDGELRGYVADIGFKAAPGETLVVPTLGRIKAKELLLAGLGDPDSLDLATVRRAAGAAARRISDRREAVSGLHLDLDFSGAARATVEGFLLGSYSYRGSRSESQTAGLERIVVSGVDDSEIEPGVITAEATLLARDLVNEPANRLPPDALAGRARAIAEGAGLGCEVLGVDELERLGFGGLLAVGRASERPPCLIVMRYSPPSARGRVALVGKGVTYDSGGLSIKTATSMETMKTDMAGGAAVIATMGALPRLGVTKEVLAFIPTCENLISGRGARPGDVITHYGGKTAEINNTDSEGRLILADAVAYASEHDPETIVDVATLTGGISIALGRRITGLLSNRDDLAAEIEAAAVRAGEPIWRLPLFDEYRRNLDSPAADIRNFGGRDGSPILGALYIRDFVRPNIPWAHLDIAGTGRSDADREEISRGGTGAGTRTMIAWLEDRSR